MISSDTSNLTKRLAAELAAAGPRRWDEIVAYIEVVVQRGQAPFAVSCAEFSANGKIDRDFRITSPVIMAALDFQAACASEGDNWSGVAIRLSAAGHYSCKFYYGSTPLADGEQDETRQRIDGVWRTGQSA